MTGKIYITGDTHRRFSRFNVSRFPAQKNLDIYSCLNADERSVFKHIKESEVQSLIGEEAQENRGLLTYLATH